MVWSFEDRKNYILQCIENLKSEDSTITSQAGKILHNLSDEGDVDLLVAALSDTSWYVRLCLSSLLSNLRSRKAVPSLIELLNDPVDIVRERAIVALGNIGDVESFDPLLAALENDEESSVRYAAAIALGQLGDKRALPVLTKVEKEDKAIAANRYEVSEGAAKAIELIRNNS